MNFDKRNIHELLRIGELVTEVCRIAERQYKSEEMAQLAAGYWKAICQEENGLALRIREEMVKADKGQKYLSIDELEEAGEISHREAALCRNYLNK